VLGKIIHWSPFIGFSNYAMLVSHVFEKKEKDLLINIGEQ